MAAKESTVTLNNGIKMPTFGLGTWLSKPGEVAAAVEVALREGYRLIDCAFIYQNEKEIGGALQKCFKEGVLKREELFVTSKLGNGHQSTPEDVLECCQSSLKALQLDYLDLYLIHVPWAIRKNCVGSFPNLTEDDKLFYSQEAISKTWAAMEDLVSKGLVKAIGLSNFSITKTEDILKTAKIAPAVNQVECNPCFQQKKLKDYCDRKGIVFEAYAPIGSPGRYSKQDDEPNVMEDPVIKEIAEKLNASPAQVSCKADPNIIIEEYPQVCISFLLHQGMVVIPKSVNPKRISENLKATQIKLDAEDIERIRAIDKPGQRVFRMEFFFKEGMTWQEAWDEEADQKFELVF